MRSIARVSVVCLCIIIGLMACQQEYKAAGKQLSATLKDSDSLTREETEILREQLLCRNWIFAEILGANGADAQRLEVFRPVLDATFRNARFDFSQSGRYEFSLAGDTERGEWHLSGNGSNIVTVEDGTDEEMYFAVEEVSEKKLVLTVGDNDVTLLLVPYVK